MFALHSTADLLHLLPVRICTIIIISLLVIQAALLLSQIAGLEHEPAPAPSPKPAIPRDDWSRQLERVYSSAGSGSAPRSGGGGSSRPPSNPMVKIVGYDSPAQQSSYSQYKSPDNGRYSRQPAQSDYNEYAGSLNQGNIAGELRSASTGALALTC